MQLTMGLGFVLSFGYWCTDFLVVQRAMVTRSMRSAQNTPLIATFPKMFMPLIVITPGLIAAAMVAMHSGYEIPMNDAGTGPNYNMVLPSMLNEFYPSGILGVGLTALFASFMSGMAGNVTAFNTVWTYDIYESYIRPGKSDKHYLHVGRWATLFGIIASVGTAYLARGFNNIMDFLQLVFGFVTLAICHFCIGMFWKRSTGHGAFYGLVGGTLAATLTYNLTVAEGNGGAIAHLYEFSSAMAQSFMVAIIAFTTCFVLTIIISLFTKPHPKEKLVGLVYSLTPRPKTGDIAWYKRPVSIGIFILVLVLILNLIFM